jgi:ubiquinone/menaquinone biosynthesis C-methylase UbiE
MTKSAEYVLGQSAKAAHRLEIQDAHLAQSSEALLDMLELRSQDHVVELGCGPGTFSHRILRRLGPGGRVRGIDMSASLLAQAAQRVAGLGQARFEPVVADVAQLGPWLDDADVVVGRAVLHHVPMAELLLGRLRTKLRPGTRVGWLEPDFRSPLGRIAYFEATTLPEVAPLRVWAFAINQLYLARRLSPDVGATLAQTLETAGYRNVHSAYAECSSNAMMIENMLMFYEEVSDHLQSLGILTAEEIAQQQQLLPKLAPETLPPAWGNHRAACEA